MGGQSLLPEGVGVDLRHLLVAVDHEHLPGPGAEVLDPPQQAVPIGVGGEAVEVDDPRPHGDLLAEELDRADAVEEPSAQAALGLIAHEHHGALRPPEVVLEVVADTAGVAHTGGGDDHLRGRVQVEGAGLIAALGDGEAGELEQGPALEGGDGLLVQIAVEIPGEDAGGLAGQGGVHHHGKAGHALDEALLLHLPDEVQQLLGAAHGEGGDDDVAALLKGLVDDLGQSLGIALRRLVEPVAVGALGEHVVGVPDVLGVADDGLIPVADVAGKDHLAGVVPLGEPHLHAGRAQQVPGVHEAHLHPVGDLEGGAVLAGDDALDRLLRVVNGVEGFHRLLPGPLALLVLPLGVALLDVGGVPQHDGQKLPRQAGAVDVAGEALLHQQGDAAGVVDVGVGDHHGVDVPGGKVQLLVVPLVPALLQAAVHQNLLSPALHTVAASGDGPCRAEKGQFHGAPPCAVSTRLLYS